MAPTMILRATTIVLLFLPSIVVGQSGLCDRIHPESLPDECGCSEPGHLALVIECDKVFNSTFFNDTIGIKLDLEPCNPEGSSLSLDITELEHDIDYVITGIKAGEDQNYPIPGLAVVVPGLGHLGMDVDVNIFGTVDQLTVKVGLNACLSVGSHLVCAGSIPGLNAILPWWILEGTYSFGDICNSTAVLEAYGTRTSPTEEYQRTAVA